MRQTNLFKGMKRGAAVVAIVSFLTMPSNMVLANNITQGNSAIGGLTDIKTNGNVTDITSKFVQNGTGMNHFGNFDVAAGNVANLLGADRYINMVDKGININGTLNAFTNGQLPANVMFISPEGMAVGAGGILNVGSLQMVNTTLGDYNSLIQKAGVSGSDISLTEADFVNLKAGGNAFIQIDGKIYSAGDVVIQAGNGIYFKDGGIIDTTRTVDGINSLGDITLFTNTGDIVGDGVLNIDSRGNLTLSAKNGGIGQEIVVNSAIYGEKVTVTPLNVKLADGKKVNIEVADTIGNVNEFKGHASVANNETLNFEVGSVKGANIKVENKGFGSIITTEDIKDVGSIYLNGTNGAVQVNNDVTAKEIIRINGKVGIDADGNLKVTDNGYISLYSKDGAINMNDAYLNMGNIDIKAGDGNVNIGNITIAQRGDAEGVLRLEDNQKLSTGIKAPDTYRFDGVHITASNGNIVQEENTKIASAGRVDLLSSGDADVTVKATDLISGHIGGDANLIAEGNSRLGSFEASNLTVSAGNIMIDGVVDAGKVNIIATDKITIRPNTSLDENHRTYGAIKAVGDVVLDAMNGIYATEQRPEGPMISSSASNINLETFNDIKVLNSSDSRITVSAGGNVNAKGQNVNIKFVQDNGTVGLIKADTNANIGASGNLMIAEKVEAGQNVVIDAVGNILQSVDGATVVSGGDASLKSSVGDIVLITNIADVLDVNAAQGNIKITGVEDLNILNAIAGEKAEFVSPKNITITSLKSGSDTVLNAGNDIVAIGLNVDGQLYADALDGKVDITANDKLVIGQINAKESVNIKGSNAILQGSDVPAVKTEGDLVISSTGNDIGAIDKYLTTDVAGVIDATATNGSIYIKGVNDLNVANAQASQTVALTAVDSLNISSLNSGKNAILRAGKNISAPLVKVGGVLDATADNGNIDIASVENLTLGQVIASNDVQIVGSKNIYQTGSTPAVTAGNNLKITSENGSIGEANNYISVKVDGALDADALNGNVYIDGVGDLNYNKVQAGQNVGLKAEGNLNQIGAFDVLNPSVISGADMYLGSSKGDVGSVNNPISVKVGNALSADATQGNVYIGANDNLTVNKITAGKDVSITSNGYIHQTTNGTRPAITSGKNMYLVSNNDNIGDPNNYLTVNVGEKLSAEAKNGGVYIYGYGDLTVDNIKAAKDVGLGGNKNIIIPSDRKEGNIIAGGHVDIKAGDSVLNGGGKEAGIVAESLNVVANLNQKEKPGSIGVLPYNDLLHSINVLVKGDVKADEVGVAQNNKILNINRMNMNNDVVPSTSGLKSDEVDERDQRNLQYLTDDENGSASARNYRQDLRYNVAASEYVVIDSATDSGAKVQDVLNISKHGMLVQTNELPKVGENIQITMDYKGLPFTVDGQVVRTNAADGTAGIRFDNIDQFTSSMILYLGMMNGI